KYEELIGEELNVKRVRLLDTASDVIDYKLHPLPRQLGRKYGADFPAIRRAIQALEPGPAAESLLAGDSLDVELDGGSVEVLPEEVEVRLEARPGFAAVGEDGYVAALDTEVSPTLRSEGLAREVVRRVQDLRKQADFDVDDRIHVEFSAEGELQQALVVHEDYIRGETLAESIAEAGNPAGEVVEAFDIEGFRVALGVTRA
ncbi:MAG: DUF5915 domain-containing protein, partial [Anaerolineales bacterium]